MKTIRQLRSAVESSHQLIPTCIVDARRPIPLRTPPTQPRDPREPLPYPGRLSFHDRKYSKGEITLSRPVQLSFAIAFACIAAVLLLHLVGQVIPALAAWVAVPVLLLGAALIGRRVERRDEHRFISVEGT